MLETEKKYVKWVAKYMEDHKDQLKKYTLGFQIVGKEVKVYHYKKGEWNTWVEENKESPKPSPKPVKTEQYSLDQIV